MQAVHPHMRGDNVFGAILVTLPRGSPPHAWGQCPPLAPAWRLWSVNPHMRGDNAAPAVSTNCVSGSPPHAWGQCRAAHHRGDDLRFTPTCVGTISRGSAMVLCYSVHPHMRGDNAGMHANLLRQGGSPPHAWG